MGANGTPIFKTSNVATRIAAVAEAQLQTQQSVLHSWCKTIHKSEGQLSPHLWDYSSRPGQRYTRLKKGAGDGPGITEPGYRFNPLISASKQRGAMEPESLLQGEKFPIFPEQRDVRSCCEDGHATWRRGPGGAFGMWGILRETEHQNSSPLGITEVE